MSVSPLQNLDLLQKLTLPQIRYKSYAFNGPYEFPPVFMMSSQGIYAIVVPDARFKPRPFRLLYIGQSSELSERLSSKHEKYEHWKREAGGFLLHYAYFTTNGWTDQQRKNAEEELIRSYDAPCNTMLRSLWGFI